MKTKKQTLSLEKIRIDGGTQPRAAIREDVVDDYAEFIREGGKFRDDVDVFFDGKQYILADGFHRYHSYRKEGRKKIPVRIHKGTLSEAQLFAVGANESHGLRRTAEDKHEAVKILLSNPDWYRRSDKWAADTCHVSNHLVAKIRAEMPAPSVLEKSNTADEETLDKSNAVEPESNGAAPAAQRTRTDRTGREQPAKKSGKARVIPQRLLDLVTPKRHGELQEFNESQQAALFTLMQGGMSCDKAFAEAREMPTRDKDEPEPRKPAAPKPVGREPGDDTETTPVYDWTNVDHAIGMLAAEIDLVGTQYKAKTSSEANSFRLRLRTFKEDFRTWGQRLLDGEKKDWMPEPLDTPAFREAWARWLQHRIETKHPLKAMGQAALIKKLAGWGAEKAIQALEHSMSNGWQGVFDPDTSGGKGNGKQTTQRQNNRYVPKPGED